MLRSKKTYSRRFFYTSFKQCILLTSILLVWGATACVREDRNVCTDRFIAVKVTDGDGKDITYSGLMKKLDFCLFDEQGFIRPLFLDSITNQLRFTYVQGNYFFITAWGNALPDYMHQSSLQNDIKVSATTLILKADDQGYSRSVPELFYGSLSSTDPSCTSCAPELIMRPRTSIVRIKVNNIDGSLSKRVRSAVSSDDYHAEIIAPHHGVTFTGEPIVGESRFKVKGNYSQGAMETIPLRIIEDKGLKVTIFKNSTSIYSIMSDQNGNPLTAPPGKELYIYVDMTYAQVKLDIQIRPWNQNDQDSGIGI